MPNVEIPEIVNASNAPLTATPLATVVDAPLNVSTKFTVPVGIRFPVGLMLAAKNSVCGAAPVVNAAKVPPPVATSTLATVVLLALPTVTVTGADTLGAKVPSPS